MKNVKSMLCRQTVCDYYHNHRKRIIKLNKKKECNVVRKAAIRGGWTFRVRISLAARDIAILRIVQTDCGRTSLQFTCYWCFFFPQGQSGRGVQLTFYLHLVPRLRISGSIHLLPYTLSCRGQGKCVFRFYCCNCYVLNDSGDQPLTWSQFPQKRK